MKTTLALLLLFATAAPAQSVERLFADVPFHFDGLDLAPDGWLYFAGSWKGEEVWRARPDGEQFEVVASQGFAGPTDCAMDSAGNLYVTNYNSTYISVVRPDGTVERFVDTPLGPSGIVVDSRDNVFVNIFGPPAGNPEGAIWRISPEGESEVWVQSADLRSSVGLAIDDRDVLYVLNGTDARVFRVPGAQQLEHHASLPLAAGRGGGAHLDWAGGRLFASSGIGAVYAIDPNGALHYVMADGDQRTALGPPVSPLLEGCNGLAVSDDGRHLYLGCTSDGARTVVHLDLSTYTAGAGAPEAWAKLQAGDTAGARNLFAALAETDAVTPGIVWGLGLAEYGERNWEVAAKLFERAAATPQLAPHAWYNRACCFSHLRRAEDGLRALGRAIDVGFADAAQLASDPDLAFLRTDSGWAETAGRLEPPRD